jgi:hypothetical protein
VDTDEHGVEQAMTDELRLIHEYGESVRVHWGAAPLLRYVYMPWEAQRESPRPYFHPVRTLAGSLVSLYRPHDHVWHKGIALSMPNVGPANFWGGATFVRDQGYVQLPNNGSMRHVRFEDLQSDEAGVRVEEDLEWVTEDGQTWFSERRSFAVAVNPEAGAWTLVFVARITNLIDEVIPFGSPTTAGRDNAGYGGLFWRGPRSFTEGTVYAPGTTGGDELMGLRAPWMAFTGHHDGHGRASTLVMVDAPSNPGHPNQWFVRETPFACLGSAPFFSEEVPVAPRETLTLRYATVIADGDPGPDGCDQLAKLGLSHLDGLAW